MAFKLVTLSALLAVASAGYIAQVPTHYSAAPTVVAKVVNPAVDAVASTHQNVVRSFDGTVSQYSKSVHTPYSSVHKTDTRVNNNVYSPTLAKTVTYAAPASKAAVYTTHSTPVYTHQQPHTVYSHEQPQAHAIYTSSAPHAVYTHEQPKAHAVYTSSAPHSVYTHEQPQAHAVYASPAPAVYTHAAPAAAVYAHGVPSTATTTYNHGPAATTYSHNAPGVSAYGSSQTIHYSPAEMVSHMSFDGFGTHWGY